jgi:hypothetical protein
VARKSGRIARFLSWKSLALVVGGGAALALTDLFAPPSTLLYLAGIAGAVIAASVYKYGYFEDQREFPITVVITIALCVIGSIWAGFCRHMLCSLLCTFWQLNQCKYCSVEFVQALIFVGGAISTLMGVLFSFTLGKQSLVH